MQRAKGMRERLKNPSTWMLLVTVILIVIFGIIGLINPWRGGQNASSMVAPTATMQLANGQVKVMVKGEVAQPGIYYLDQDSTIQELIRAAGGLTKDAYLGKIDLRAQLKAGQTVTIPKNELGGMEYSADGRVYVNTASKKVIEFVPFLTGSQVDKLMEGRPFFSWQALVERIELDEQYHDMLESYFILN